MVILRVPGESGKAPLDCHGARVRAGVVVAEKTGFRWLVRRVRGGEWYGRRVTAFGTLGMETAAGRCSDVCVIGGARGNA